MISILYQANTNTAPGFYWTAFHDGTARAIREWNGHEWLTTGQSEPEPADWIMLLTGRLEES